MENGQKIIRGLFDGSKIFNIPEYQRAYAWEEKQLGDFVDDIENQRLDKDYFFGTILFQEKGISDDFEVIDIVDGQQRITTLIIFMKILIDQLKEHRDEGQIRRLEARYIQLDGKYKLQVLQDDNDFFKSYILQDNLISEREVETPSQRRLLKARGFLYQRIQEYPLETLSEFKDKIERTKILTYSVEDNAEATLIFETTNDRGKSLTNLEKTKSFLMYKTYLVSNHPEPHLNDIQNRFSEIYRNYEKIDNKVEEDTILQSHFIAFEKWTQKSEYQNYVPKIKQQVHKLVNNPGTELEAMNFIDRYSLELKESFVFMSKLLLNREPYLLDIFALDRPAVFYPLLIKAYKFDESTGKQDFKRIARLVEIICFRFSIERSRSDNGREKLYRMARDFNQDFEELIRDLKRFIDAHCYNSYFRSHLSSPNFYDEVNSNYQQYLFWKYENYLRIENQPIFSEMSHDEFANRDPRTKLSIEHIGSQTPTSPTEMTQEFRENYLHNIGNLTIDTLGANSSKSNRDFEYKYEKYYSRSPLKQQNELKNFIKEQTGKLDWDDTAINSRRERILEFALDYWNHKDV